MIAHYILKRAGQLAMGFMFLMLVGFTVENPPKQTSSSPIILADKGQALMPIVISPSASPAMKETARELKLYLDQITGASFRIEDGDGASGIVLGTLSQFPEKRLQKDLEIRDGYDGREAYAIRSSTNRLLLLGATDLGASHAAFRLLEHVGCRWFFPAKEWEVIPKITSLDVNLSESDRPVFLSRNDRYASFDKQDKQNYLAWFRHNRVAESLTVRSWHTYPYILVDNKAVFEAHPEYLALKKDGKRDSTNLCLSQPAVRQMAVQYALNWLKNHPADDMAPMDPSDGAGLCECEQCQSTFKTISNAAFGLANEVAAAVAKQYPGKMVGIYAYASHSEPPDFSLNDNVYVTLTIGNFSSHDTFDEFVKRWRKKCKHFSSGYEYYSAVYDGCGRSFDTPGLPPGGRLANLKYLQESIRSYAANGSRIITGGRESDFGIHGIGNYVANRLMWNPQVNVPALLEDFYAKAFGDAAPVMKRYYERFDCSHDPLISESFFALALRDLAEASRMVPNSPEIQARLNHLKIYLRYASLGWRMRHEADDNRRRELCRQIYTIIYRQRYTGMVGWYRFQAELATLPDSLPKDRAWMTALPEGPYSDAEIAREFAESLEQFQPDPVEEIAFSRKLVPLVLGESPPVAVRHNYYSRNIYSLPYTGVSPVYVIHCLDDKPLEIGFKAAMWADLPGPDATYRVTDGDGQLIQSGQIPITKAAAPLQQSLQVKTPGPGIYYLKCEQERGANITVVFPDTLPIALELYRGRPFHYTGVLPEMYFYVPKGTRQINYYWEDETHTTKSPHTVKGPHGEVIQQVRASGRLVHVPVPAGADGQVWSLANLQLGQLWFFNVPNYLSPSPKRLLLPEDLVKKDNLRGDGINNKNMR